MTTVASSLGTTQPYIPLVNPTQLGRAAGLVVRYPSLTALNAAVAAERTNISASSSIWFEGTEMSTGDEPIGVCRTWNSTAQHARTVILPGARLAIVLAGDSNTVGATAGTPSGGNDGDLKFDANTGLYYIKSGGSWSGGTSYVPSGSATTTLHGIPGFSSLNLLSEGPVKSISGTASPFHVPVPASGSAVTIATRPSGESGTVLELQMSMSSSIHWDLRLRVYWDQATAPDIDVDLGTLFCSHGDAHTGTGQHAKTGHVGMTVTGTNSEVGIGGMPDSASYALSFDMPYGNGFTAEIYCPPEVTVPGGATAIYALCKYRTDVTSSYRLRSRAQTRTQGAALSAYAAAADIPFFDMPNNAGWLVWFSMYVFGASNYSYLERPYYFFRDGEGTPSYFITGGEEWGDTGYYFGFNTRLNDSHIMMTAGNNANLTTTLGVDLLQYHGGVKFLNELRAVWTNKTGEASTSNHQMAYCFLFYVDTSVAFVPTAPQTVTATTGSTTATVNWKAPASQGSNPLTAYTVTLSPSGATQTVAANVLTASFTGLTNGVAYTPTVVATSSRGSSTGATGSAFTPAAAAAPNTPTIGAATGGNASASVAFTAAGSGAAATSFTVTSSPGSFTATGSASPLNVTGLTNGTAYTFTAHATNAGGSSAESAASNSVTPSGVVISDNFNRADAAALGSTQTGQSWSLATSGGTGGPTPVGHIVGNMAYVDSTGGTVPGNCYAFVNAGKADVDITAVVGAIGSHPNFGNIFARYTDTDNHVDLYLNAQDAPVTGYGIQTRIAGAYTTIGTVSVTPAPGDSIRMKVTGTAVDVYINGTHFGPFTATGINTTGQNVGFAMSADSGSSTARFDSFIVS